ncbi:MAG: hypothetical protein WA323_27840, partial [Candidatus Nitrosopolaris sp.]
MRTGCVIHVPTNLFVTVIKNDVNPGLEMLGWKIYLQNYDNSLSNAKLKRFLGHLPLVNSKPPNKSS